MIEKIGVQLYTIRDYMNTEDEIRDSFIKLKKLGYDEVQTAEMRISYEKLAEIADETGISIVGTHTSFDYILENIQDVMQNNKTINCTNVGIGGYNDFDGEDTIKKFIDNANKVAETLLKNGFKFTYHNHSHEFVKVGKKTIMERLVQGLTSKSTSFVLDTYWVQHGGGDIRQWIEMLNGRIDIIHLKDMGRNKESQFITEVGNGNLYWDGIIDSAEKCGVKYFVVEQDICPGNPFDSLKASSDFIHNRYM